MRRYGASCARQDGGMLRSTSTPANGFVRRDQLILMARSGFNSFELPDSEIDNAAAALSTFSFAYQPSNDAGLPLKLQRRPWGTPASA